MADAISVHAASATGIPVRCLWPSWPRPSVDFFASAIAATLVSSSQQCRKTGPMLGAMDLGVADDGERAGHEQAAQIAVALFADTAEPVLASA